jgi:hypothetical protein
MSIGSADRHEHDESLFTLNARLPEQVFRQPAIQYRFGEFDIVFSEHFWYGLARLAEGSGDTIVHAAVIDPPDAYYNGLGVSTKKEISTNSLDSYLEWLHRTNQDSRVDSIAYTAEVIVFQPPSATWAIWAQRNLEVTVLAVFDEIVDRSTDAETIRWFSLSEALHHLIALRYSDQAVPTSLSATLLKNYG